MPLRSFANFKLVMIRHKKELRGTLSHGLFGPVRKSVTDKTRAVFCSKIADAHGIEVCDVRTWKFVYFRKISRFLLHIAIFYPK